jgi:hypothetical protein
MGGSGSQTRDDKLPLWCELAPTIARHSATRVISVPAGANARESCSSTLNVNADVEKRSHAQNGDIYLHPAKLPPRASIYDYLPFSLPFKFIANVFTRVIYKTWDDRSGRARKESQS